MKTQITIFFAALALFFLAPTFSFAQTPVSGTLSADTTWTAANSPYLLNYTVIPSGITLAIEEGAVIKFSDARATLEVNGNLVVGGTESSPAYFTSINDNTVGGDTGTGAPHSADWGNIMVKEGGMAEINHAVIRYGGYTGWLTSTASSNLYNRGGTLAVSNSVIGNSISGVTHVSGTTALESDIISENSQGISASGTGSLTLSHSAFLNNSENAAYLDLSSGIAFVHSANTATGGNQSGFFLRGTIPSDYIFEKDAMPYIIGFLEILAGKTVTARSGAVFKLGGIGSHVRISGNLHTEGTETEPVYFTSIKDDTILGDTNGDGGATTPAPTDWAEIVVLEGGEADFNHSVVRYGGQYSWGIWTNSANISNQGGALTVSNSEISSGVIGIHHLSGTTALSGNIIKENSIGLQAGGQGSLAFSNNIFSNNTNSATYLDISGGLVFVHGGNQVVGTRDLGFALRGTAVSDQTLSKDGVPYLVSYLAIPAGKTLSIAPGAVIKMSGIDSQISVSGTLLSLGTKDEPIYFTSIKDDTILGDTNGDENATTPAPTDWAEIAVLEGGAAHFAHAIIRYGGQYSWGIWTNNAEFANRGGTLDIADSEIAYGAIGVYHSAGTTTVSQSSIHDNAGYGIYNATTQTLHAENNWWGDASGPRHASNGSGTGDNVSDRVDFTPWLGYDPTIETPLTLSNPTETEDDNNQDAKGAADKTVFTFTVTAEGTPDTVTLIAVDQFGEARVVKAKPSTEGFALTTYVATSTFPKGHYTWHIEAAKGSETPRTADRTFTTGYSNVAFLPGLEASRLYRPATDPDDPSVTKVRLWEPPLFLQDNAQLFLNPDGTPMRNDIFTGDVIDEAIGFNIYKNFIASMDKLVTDRAINAWKPLPYDWRFDIHDIVENPIALATTSYSMIDEIQKLAERSDTGKVTIIAHSNGGLVGKTLISELESRGQSDALDKFIMVAVPQLGTPKAVAALLHGEGMPSDMLPVLLSKSDARTLGENMPSGYSLLPSAEYLARVIDPVASFDSTDVLTAPYFAQYGSVITNPTELHGFLLGAEGRAKPATNDTFTPNKLNETLLLQAESNHAILDNWQAPENVEVIQIAGWGLDTIKGLKYYETDPCILGCPILDHEPEFTADGDETVVVPSATASTIARTYYLDLPKHNTQLGVSGEFGLRRNRDHSNILEVTELQILIKDLLRNTSELIENISTIKPPVEDIKKRLRLKIHSPVSLHLHNSLGEHTGIATTTGSIQIIEKQIPNSYYFEMGEGKYSGTEENGTTTITLLGEALGTFTLDIEEVEGNAVVANTTFANIPVTASSTAAVVIETLSSALPKIAMDVDGDGTVDATVSSGDGVTSQELLSILKGIIKTLDLPEKKETKLLKKIEKIEKELMKEDKHKREEKHKTGKAFEEIIKQIKKFEKKKLITAEEAAELISIIEQIKEKVVK